MNDKVMRHKQICNELNKLYERKNHDYGDSFHQTFVEEGFAMVRIRLADKFNRFKTLIKQANSIDNLIRKSTDSGDTKVLTKNQQVTDESIRDTLLDLANYAIMTVLELDKAESGKNTKPPVPYSPEFYAQQKKEDGCGPMEEPIY